MVDFTINSIVSDVVAATELGSYLLQSDSDSVAVLDSANEQVIKKARPLRIGIREIIRPMDHPIESGQKITDYKITLPIEINMPCIVSSSNYRETYHEIYDLFNKSELLTIQTRVRNYKNMILSAIPHEQDPERYDVITINLNFKQIIIVGQENEFVPSSDTQNNLEFLGFQIPSVYTLLGAPLGVYTTAQSIAARVR